MTVTIEELQAALEEQGFVAIMFLSITADQLEFLMNHCSEDLSVQDFVRTLIDQARSPQQ